MKKIWITGVALSLCGLTHATTVNVLSSATLVGTYAYTEGVPISLAANQQIASAQIDWSNVTLTHSGNSQGTGMLYTDLINSSKTGLKSYTDNDSAGDYLATKFSGNITSLGSKLFASVGTSLSWSYVLNGAQLAALNSYLSNNNGVFNIGFDPDCYYTVGGLKFTYTATTVQPHNVVPDGATTALLLIAGLAGVEMFRRKLAVALAVAS